MGNIIIWLFLLASLITIVICFLFVNKKNRATLYVIESIVIALNIPFNILFTIVMLFFNGKFGSINGDVLIVLLCNIPLVISILLFNIFYKKHIRNKV